jgi:multiple sugar transport system ATP-binding protein
MAAIDFDRVGKRYGKRQPVVIHDASLAVGASEFCVFLGPSGCGKSTLLRLVAGLEDIDRGEIRIGGRRVNELPPARRGVAMVFQGYALYPHMTVAQNLAFGLRVFGADRAAIERRVRQAAEKLQLTPLLDRLPRELSGGQRQRVAIGRAIVKSPGVFLFDEPLSNLDAALRVQTRLEIARLHRESGDASTLYVTHDQVEAMTLADRIVLLRAGDAVATEGSVAQVGTPMDLYHRPRNLFVAGFIGSPAMNLLPGRLLAADVDHARVEVLGVAMTVAVDARRAGAGDVVTLGIRPEHLTVGEDGPGASLALPVTQTERLGDVSLLYLAAGAEAPPVTLRVDGACAVAPGQQLTLGLQPEQCHLFDAAGVAFERTVALPS